MDVAKKGPGRAFFEARLRFIKQRKKDLKESEGLPTVVLAVQMLNKAQYSTVLDLLELGATREEVKALLSDEDDILF